MKVKQQNVKSFEFTVDEPEAFFKYIQTNLALFQGHLLILKGDRVSDVLTFLEDNSLCYVNATACELQTKKRQTPVVVAPENNKLTEKVEKKVVETSTVPLERMVIHRPLRSGEELVTNQDVTVFGRVNSGARIECKGNVEIFGLIDGTIIANGEYLLIQHVGSSGVVSFHAQTIDHQHFDGTLKKIMMKNDQLVIKELA
jgi:septum site-determining protein MinC